MAITTKKITDWLASNAGQASMIQHMNQNLRPLQDGVYIGKKQKEASYDYLKCEPWQTTNIGIAKADADCIVIQHGGYRLGIALTEPAPLKWGSSTTVRVNVADDLNSFNGAQLTANIMKNDAYKNDDAATYAVAYANKYSKSHDGDPGGTATIAAGSWWLPTMGDLALIHVHFETINLALQRIKNAGKQSADLLVRAAYWSCCEASTGSARYLAFGVGNRGGNGKGTTYRVRPVTAF